MKSTPLILALAAFSIVGISASDGESATDKYYKALQGVWVLPKPIDPFKSARIEVKDRVIWFDYERQERATKAFKFSAPMYEVTKDRILFSEGDGGMAYVMRDGKLGIEVVSKDYKSIGQILLEKQK